MEQLVGTWKESWIITFPKTKVMGSNPSALQCLIIFSLFPQEISFQYLELFRVKEMCEKYRV